MMTWRTATNIFTCMALGMMLAVGSAPDARGADADKPSDTKTAAPEALRIGDFEDGLDGFSAAEHVKLTNTTERGVMHGQKALVAELSPEDEYPGISKTFDTPQDWSGYDCLMLNVFNPNAGGKTSVSLRIDDASSAGYKTRFNLEGIALKPGANMIEVPTALMAHAGVSQWGIDLRKVKSMTIFTGQIKARADLIFDDISLLRFPRAEPDSREIMVNKPERNWKGNDGSVEKESAAGAIVQKGTAVYPGLTLGRLGTLYGWDMVEIRYRCGDGSSATNVDAARRTLSIKVTPEKGAAMTCLAAVQGEGVVYFPLFFAYGVPLSKVTELVLFFDPKGAPAEFEVRSVKLVRLPVAAGQDASLKGPGLIVDLNAIRALVAKSPSFPCGIWAYVPRKGGGIILTRGRLDSDNSYRFEFENALANASAPAPVACYAFDHGHWAVGAKQVPLPKEGQAEVSFSLPDISK